MAQEKINTFDSKGEMGTTMEVFDDEPRNIQGETPLMQFRILNNKDGTFEHCILDKTDLTELKRLINQRLRGES